MLNNKGFIFDGFPRTESQAKSLDAFLTRKDIKINFMLALEADDNELVKRLLNRGKSSGRIDDQDETKIRNRFKEYNKNTSPLKTYYKNQNKFYSINGIGTIDQITGRLTKLIDSL